MLEAIEMNIFKRIFKRMMRIFRSDRIKNEIRMRIEIKETTIKDIDENQLTDI